MPLYCRDDRCAGCLFGISSCPQPSKANTNYPSGCYARICDDIVMTTMALRAVPPTS